MFINATMPDRNMLLLNMISLAFVIYLSALTYHLNSLVPHNFTAPSFPEIILIDGADIHTHIA